MHCTGEYTSVEYCNVQWPIGGNDCGLFAFPFVPLFVVMETQLEYHMINQICDPICCHAYILGK